MLAELYVLCGRDAGKVFEASRGPTIFLGRSATNQIRVRDSQASRVHCRIDVTADGLTIADAGSGNGTFVNDARVDGRRPLDDGDEIRLGGTRLRILIERPEEATLWPQPGAPSLEGSEEVAVRTDPSGTGRVRAGRGKLREVLPGYVLEARLSGRSSSGVAVYRAIQRSLDRPVAVKVFLPRGEVRPADVERFLREARTVARLPHRRLVTIHDVIRRGKTHAIVMEYLAGGSLADRLADRRALDPATVARAGACVAEALEHLHRHGVVHRGVKPGNVLHGRSPGSYKLAGFGLTTAADEAPSGDTCFVAAPAVGIAYLAPEQITGARAAADPRTDLYGLGATLHAVLSGAPPFEGTSAADLAAKVVDAPAPPLPGSAGALAAVVERCLAKDPAERWPNAAAFRAALRAASPPSAPDDEAP